MHGSSEDSGDPRGRDRYVTVLYRGDGTTVTYTSFESGGRRYPVAELDQIERVHGGFLWTRWFELRAQFRGELVRLFQCYNKREFGQVSRALLRARELFELV